MDFKDSVKIASDLIPVRDGEDVQEDISNRPHDQAFSNTDYLASALNADRNLVISGGGTLKWGEIANRFEWDSAIYIERPNEVIGAGSAQYRSTISSGSFTFSGSSSLHQILAVKVSRSTNTALTSANIESFASMQTLKTAIEAATNETTRFEYVVLASRDLDNIGGIVNNLIIWSGKKIRYGFRLDEYGATDTQYAQQDDFEALNYRENQDRNTFLASAGVITWAGPGSGLVLSENVYVAFPTNVVGTITAATLSAITNNQCYAMTLSRTDGGTPSLTVSTYAWSDTANIKKESDNLLVLGYVRDDRLYLCDGTVIESGFQGMLGGIQQGTRWIFRGIGDGNQYYDFADQLLIPGVDGGKVVPSLTTPEYHAGASELLVFVNGVLQMEGTFTYGSAIGDYDEATTGNPTPSLGDVLTGIKWTADHYPTADDTITAMVGLCHYWQNHIVPALEVTNADGSVVAGTILFSTDGQIREDALTDQTIELTYGEDGSKKYVKPAVGGYIADPVRGRCRHTAGGSVTEGALNVFHQRPVIFYDDDEVGGAGKSLIVSPGEIMLPLTEARETWITYRNYWPLRLSLATDVILPDGENWPAVYPAPVYFYATAGGVPKHDANFTVVGLPFPPDLYISDNTFGSGQHWLSYVDDPQDLIYLGSAMIDGDTPSVAPDIFVPFDRVGDTVIFRPGFRDGVTYGEPFYWNYTGIGGGSPGTNLGAITPVTYLPHTASAARLLPLIDINMTNYVDPVKGAGVAITGLNLYSGYAGVPAVFQDDVLAAKDEADVVLISQPMVASTPGTPKRVTWSPIDVAINNYTAHVGPTTPSIGCYCGPYLDRVAILVMGYTEPFNGIHRHGKYTAA